MTFCRSLLFLAGSLAFAADEQQLALAMRAQFDFEKVRSSTATALPDTWRCVQSQAAWLPVASPAELPTVHFRKGYCSLAEATITRNPAAFELAAGEFEKAIDTWPQRAGPKALLPEPVSSGLRILAQVARLSSGDDSKTWDRARQELPIAIQPPACSANVMPTELCQRLTSIAREWLGYIALQRNDLYEAGQEFREVPENAWSHWIAGRREFGDRNYKEAAAQFRVACDLWSKSPSERPSAFFPALEPQPNMTEALTDLGGAQLLSGDNNAAMVSLNAAIRLNNSLPRAVYLRARAEELSGKAEQALADYNLASRIALASTKDLASGEAHLYRGIMLYRRKDYQGAEEEFANALNFEISAPLRPDAVAWRHMSAVAGGACGGSRPLLEESLASVTPYFPKAEARKLASTCPLTGGSVATGGLGVR
jgi:tetratricopeptide (TPR) repeat protein